jgi:hypothetical protein
VKLNHLTVCELCSNLSLRNDLTELEHLLLDKLISVFDALTDLQTEYNTLTTKIPK